MEALLCLVAAMYEKRVVQHSELVPSYVQLAYLKNTNTDQLHDYQTKKLFFLCFNVAI